MNDAFKIFGAIFLTGIVWFVLCLVEAPHMSPMGIMLMVVGCAAFFERRRKDR